MEFDMLKEIGKIDSIDGLFYIKNDDGSLSEISKGSIIHEGDIVVGDASNKAIDSLIVGMNGDYPDTVVMSNHSQLFDSSLSSAEYAQNDTVTDKESIDALIEDINNEDIINEDVSNEDNIDEIKTESGSDFLSPLEIGEAEFTKVNNDSVDINANLIEDTQQSESNKEDDNNNNISRNYVSNEVSSTDSGEDSNNPSATSTNTTGDSSQPTQPTIIDNDTTRSSTPMVTADIADVSDTGSSNTDNITSDNTPTINGTGEAGSTVVITDAQGDEVGSAIVDSEGNYSITTSELSDGSQSLTVTSTDTSGNSAQTTQAITVDTIAGDTDIDGDGTQDSITPTVTITQDSNNDGTINESENQGESNFEIALAEGTVAGDTINLDINGTTSEVTITDDMITAGKYESSTPTPTEGETLNIKASVTDSEGNTTEQVEDSAKVDTVAGNAENGEAMTAPTVTITDDSNKDGTINSTENDETANISIAIPAGAVAGDTLDITINGEAQDSVEITQDMLDNGYETTAPTPAEGETLSVSSTVTDAQGNTTEAGTDTATVDTIAGDTDIDGDGTQDSITPTVTITQDSNNDGTINESENQGESNFEIALAEGTVAGDTINLDINGTESTVTITDDMITAGKYESSTPTPTEGQTLNIKASVTDSEGNTTEQVEDSAKVDTVAPDIGALAITNIVDNTGDASSITMSGTGAEAGNTITLYDEDNNAVATAEVQADGTWNTDISSLDGTPINDNEFFKATETDPAGNESGQTDTIHFNSFNWSNAQTDGFDDFDIMGSGDDNITVNDNDLNDKVVVDGGDGTDTATFSGNFEDYTISTDENGYTTVTENASTDSDGNGIGDVNELRNIESIKFGDGTYDPGSETFTDNNVFPAPTVVITDDTNNDGYINESEDDDSSIPKVYAAVSIPEGAEAGDVIHVSDGTTTHNITLDTTHFTESGTVTVSFDEPAEGETIDVTATITDRSSGLTSEAGTDSATLDTITSNSIGITDGNITDTDNVINANEDESVDMLGNVEAGSTIDSVVIKDTEGNSITVDASKIAVNEDGYYTVENADVSSLGDGTLTATITSTDAAGNQATSTDTIEKDTTASDMGELAITNIVDNTGDASSITMHGTGAEVGNTITLYDEDNNPVATAEVQADGTWNTDISSLDGTPINDNEFFKVTETDPAGNETGQTDTTHYNSFDWAHAQTDGFDDYAIMGDGNDSIKVNDDDVTDKVVIDGGDGDDTAIFAGNFENYTISTDANGYTIVTENVSTDSDGNGIGDVNELRNVETINFADGSYDTNGGTFNATADGVSLEIHAISTNVETTGAEGAQGATESITYTDAGSISGANHYFDDDDNHVHFDSIIGSNVYADGHGLLENNSDIGGSLLTGLNDGTGALLSDGTRDDIIEVDTLSGSNIFMNDRSLLLVDGSDGNDMLVLTGNSSDYTVVEDTLNDTYTISSSLSGIAPSVIHGAEAIVFKGDGVIYGDQDLGATVLPSATYDTTIELTATQTDTDGSETLSNVAVDVPEGVTVKDANGNELTITNNQVSVPVVTGVATSIVLVSADELTPSEINSVSGSVTTTEIGGDSDTATSSSIKIISDNDTDTANDTDTVTNDRTPTLSGTGEVGSTVVITDASGNEVGTAVVDADGNYSITTSELPTGTQSLTVTTTDASGNSAQTTQVITVDTTATITVDTEFTSGVDLDGHTEVTGSTSLAVGTLGALLEGTVTLDSTMNNHLVVDDISSGAIINGGDSSDIVEIQGSLNGDASFNGGTGEDTLVMGKSEGSYTITDMVEVDGVLSCTLLDISTGGTLSVSNIENLQFGGVSSETLAVSGTTNDVEAGQTIDITITDSTNATVATTVLVGEDGTYSTNVDVSSLNNTDLTTDVRVVDIAGNVATDSEGIATDTTASAPTLTMNIGESQTLAIQTDDIVTSAPILETTLAGGSALGAGTSTVLDGTNEWDTITTKNGDDSVTIGDNYNQVNLKNGDNTAEIGDGDSNWAEIDTGSGDDTIIAGDNWNNVTLGSGNDALQVGNADDEGSSDVHEWSTIDTGAGNDTVVAGNDWNQVELGSGNDTLNIGSADNDEIYQNDDIDDTLSYINAGEGDDTMVIGTGWDQVNGGAGNDTAIFKGEANQYTIKGDVVTHVPTGEITTLNSIENIQFSGVDGVSTLAYTYPITLNSGLTDTDGSETLSAITLDNIPVGASISGIEVNEDGTYTIPTDENGDAIVTLRSDSEISKTDLNNIQSSVTSTEENGGDTSTVTATSTEIGGTDGLDTLIGTDADEVIDAGEGADIIDTGAGADNIFFDSADTVDGGLGFDTLVLDTDDANIDFGALADNSISNIESINLGEGSQSISLDIGDVLDITDDDNILRIEGDGSDHVDLNTQGEDAEWTLGDFKTDAETGAIYQEVTGVENDATVTLEISTDINIEEN